MTDCGTGAHCRVPPTIQIDHTHVRGNTIRYSGSSVTLGVSTAGVEEYEAIVEHNYFDKTGLFAWDGATTQRTNQGAANTAVRYNWFFESHRGAMRLDAGSYPILYAKIYRNVMHDGHKGFGMNGE